MAKFDPLEIPERTRIRSFFIGSAELAAAIKRITQQEVTLQDILVAKKSVTYQNVLEYVKKNGLPEELLTRDKENPQADGYHLRADGNRFLFFYSERGSHSDIKIFEDAEDMTRHVIDHYFNTAFEK